MILGIDLKVDYAFKFTFGREQDAEPLIHLLNAVLSLPPDRRIVSIRILNPFSDKIASDDKLSILDIRARDQLGRLFDVEMQMLPKVTVPQRLLYYWAGGYVQQLQEGQDYRLLRPTISVCFVNGILFPDTPQHHLPFRVIDPGTGVVLSDDLSIHLFELPKFQLGAEELSTPLDAWLYFLRHATELDPERLPACLEREGIRQAMEALMTLTEVDVRREQYLDRFRAASDHQTLLNMESEERERIINAAINEARPKIIDEARPKIIDEARPSIIDEARPSIIAEGRQTGALIGQIETLQELLGKQVTPSAELEAMSVEALKAMAAALKGNIHR
jgi:predicted transposase/invertase (TIGR01784 family)